MAQNNERINLDKLSHLDSEITPDAELKKYQRIWQTSSNNVTTTPTTSTPNQSKNETTVTSPVIDTKLTLQNLHIQVEACKTITSNLQHLQQDTLSNLRKTLTELNMEITKLLEAPTQNKQNISVSIASLQTTIQIIQDQHKQHFQDIDMKIQTISNQLTTVNPPRTPQMGKFKVDNVLFQSQHDLFSFQIRNPLLVTHREAIRNIIEDLMQQDITNNNGFTLNLTKDQITLTRNLDEKELETFVLRHPLQNPKK